MYIKQHKSYHDNSALRSKSKALEAVKDFGLNLCKLPERLKNDKQVVLEAIKSDPFAIRMVSDENVRKDKEIADAVLKKKKYLNKYIDPMGEYIDIKKGYLTDKEYKYIEIRNNKLYEIEQEKAIRLERSATDTLDR